MGIIFMEFLSCNLLLLEHYRYLDKSAEHTTAFAFLHGDPFTLQTENLPVLSVHWDLLTAQAVSCFQLLIEELLP